MNKAVVSALAILIVMGVVVEKGESYIRAGREMVYNKLGERMPPPEEYYYTDAEVRRSPRFGSKRG